MDVETILRARNSTLRWAALASAFTQRAEPQGDRKVWADAQARLYKGLASVTGASVIVDSSKWPIDPIVFGCMDNLPILVIHLVRDPRAVAYSWMRHRVVPYRLEKQEMPRFGPLYSGLSWLIRNGTTEIARMSASSHVHWLRVRYEDLAKHPRDVLAEIVKATGMSVGGLPVDGRGVFQPEPHHMIGGNPSKGVNDPIQILPDEEWKSRLGRRQASIVTAATWPLLHRYGYSLRAGDA